uniref:Uncharacterized protein n=1 Tax=Anguilla anguilla TaxID=7936 RepID=A0A0E9RRW7_ANGAN
MFNYSLRLFKNPQTPT